MFILQSFLQNVYNFDLIYSFDTYFLTAYLVQKEEKTIDVYNMCTWANM